MGLSSQVVAHKARVGIVTRYCWQADFLFDPRDQANLSVLAVRVRSAGIWQSLQTRLAGHSDRLAFSPAASLTANASWRKPEVLLQILPLPAQVTCHASQEVEQRPQAMPRSYFALQNHLNLTSRSCERDGGENANHPVVTCFQRPCDSSGQGAVSSAGRWVCHSGWLPRCSP
jgi:hypothetical protein